MEDTTYSRFLSRAIPAFFSLPFAIVALSVAFGPARFDAASYHGSGFFLFALAFGATIAGYAALSFTLSRQKAVTFLACASVTCAALATVSVLAGAGLHRDFFSAAFQYAMALPALYVVQAQKVFYRSMQKRAITVLSHAGFVIAAFYLEWIMLMGYAIATRAEPRPIESMIYNVYNIFLTIELFISARTLGRFRKNRVEITPSLMRLDGKDITQLAGVKRTRLLYAFSTAEGRRLRCPEIQRLLYGVNSGEDTDTAASGPECSRCDPESAKAAQCGRYRSTYNSILELKKLIEFLEVGTIVTGENRRHVLEDGWRLVAFDGARIKAIEQIPGELSGK